jgi:excinuclease ABC subunit C
MELIQKIKTWPKKPGVYIMKDAKGKIIYIGKALSLRKRISDYFVEGRDTRYQINALMKKVDDIEYIVTKTEKEALLLEYNLIQENKPKYNLFLKDSKRYVSIKVSSYHKFPGIYVTRQTPKDNSTYFGPYTSSASCREVVELITSYFKIRTCSDTFFANRSRPCIQYEIKRCTAPCTNFVTKDEYGKQLSSAVMFLKGHVTELIKILKQEMAKVSKEKKYEEAGHIRDVLHNIQVMIEPQAISGYGVVNKDYIAMYQEGNKCTFAILKLRQGKIQDYGSFPLSNQLGETVSLWEQFLIQYYKKSESIPKEIHSDFPTEVLGAVQSLLSDRKGSSVKIRKPLRGVDKDRLRMAKLNAKEMFYQGHKERDWDNISETLMKKLQLVVRPEIVECVDISNISGKFAVGSLVAFSEGKPSKSNYRKYKIKAKDTPDDYAMMSEVLTRRFKKYMESNKILPDLLLVDGGKGQLAIAKRVLDELGIEGVGLASIAKGRSRKQDEIYIPGRKNPVIIKNGEAHLFLQRIRDEAHRFGIEYYRKRHRKGLITSELDKVPGIGPAKKKALLKKFSSLEKIQNATAKEISQTPGVTKSLAKKILSNLK